MTNGEKIHRLMNDNESRRIIKEQKLKNVYFNKLFFFLI